MSPPNQVALNNNCLWSQGLCLRNLGAAQQGASVLVCLMRPPLSPELCPHLKTVLGKAASELACTGWWDSAPRSLFSWHIPSSRAVAEAALSASPGRPVTRASCNKVEGEGEKSGRQIKNRWRRGWGDKTVSLFVTSCWTCNPTPFACSFL